MSPENFCYWLQGYFEISEINQLTEDQIAIIQKHLSMVFNKYPNIIYPKSDYKGGKGVSAYSGYCGLNPYSGYSC